MVYESRDDYRNLGTDLLNASHWHAKVVITQIGITIAEQLNWLNLTLIQKSHVCNRFYMLLFDFGT